MRINDMTIVETQYNSNTIIYVYHRSKTMNIGLMRCILPLYYFFVSLSCCPLFLSPYVDHSFVHLYSHSSCVLRSSFHSSRSPDQLLSVSFVTVYLTCLVVPSAVAQLASVSVSQPFVVRRRLRIDFVLVSQLSWFQLVAKGLDFGSALGPSGPGPTRSLFRSLAIRSVRPVTTQWSISVGPNAGAQGRSSQPVRYEELRFFTFGFGSCYLLLLAPRKCSAKVIDGLDFVQSQRMLAIPSQSMQPPRVRLIDAAVML